MKSLQTKILVLTLSLVLIVAAGISAVTIYDSRTVVEKDAQEILKFKCQDTAGRINNEIDGVRQSVETLYHYTLGEMEGSEDLKDEEKLDIFTKKIKKIMISTLENTDGALAAYIRFNPEYTISNTSGLFLGKKAGGFTEFEITDLSLYEEDDIEHVGWYYVPLKNKTATWMEPYYNKNIGYKMISYVIPIFLNGETIGVVGMDIDFSLLKGYVDGVSVYNSGFAFLAKSDGNILYHRDYPDGIKYEDIGSTLDVKMKSVEDVHYGDLVSYKKHGKKWKMIAEKLENGMSLVIVAPQKEISALPNTLQRHTFLSALLIILIIVIPITIRFSRSLTRPLKQLTEATNKVTEGDFEVTVETGAKDEVGTLAKSFECTIKELNRYISYMSHLAYVDTLTDTKNKAAYMKEAKEINRLMKNGERNFAVIVLDINNLKYVNDTYGHSQGDMIIMDAAKIMKLAFLEDKIFRIGGDEFAVIMELSDTDIEDVIAGFDRKLRLFNKKNKGKYPYGLQIARGYSVVKEEDEGIEDVFKRADEDMYKNKKDTKEEEVDFL